MVFGMVARTIPAAKRTNCTIGHDDAVITRQPFFLLQKLINNGIKTQRRIHGGVMHHNLIRIGCAAMDMLQTLWINAPHIMNIGPGQAAFGHGSILPCGFVRCGCGTAFFAGINNLRQCLFFAVG